MYESEKSNSKPCYMLCFDKLKNLANELSPLCGPAASAQLIDGVDQLATDGLISSWTIRCKKKDS